MVIDSLVNAGAQRQFVNLAIGLSEKQHNVKIFMYHPKYDLLPELEQAGIEYVECKKKGRFDFRPVYKLYQEARLFAPAVVISFLRTPSVYAELVSIFVPKFKLIVSERSNVFGNALSLGDVASGYAHYISDHVTSNSHDYKNHLVKRVPWLKKKTSVIYNGVNSKFLEAYRKNTVSKEKGLTKFVVVSARCESAKGALILALALKELHQQGAIDFSVDWIGGVNFDSDYVQSVVAVLAENNLTEHWNWSGKVADVSVVLPHYDALVSSSLREGVSNSTCEAMAIGLPVLVSDISDNAEIVQSGVQGFVFKSGDASALCQCLLSYMQLDFSQRLQMSKLANVRAIELFTMTKLINDWEALCQSLVGDA